MLKAEWLEIIKSLDEIEEGCCPSREEGVSR